jgi:hypothetical protein
MCCVLRVGSTHPEMPLLYTIHFASGCYGVPLKQPIRFSNNYLDPNSDQAGAVMVSGSIHSMPPITEVLHRFQPNCHIPGTCFMLTGNPRSG